MTVEAAESVLLGVPGYDPLRESAGYEFDEEEAARAVSFFPRLLVHYKGFGAGRPFHLEPWQQSIVANMFGWRSQSTGLRRYRTVFVYVPRGNGKTAWSAGIVCFLLTCDREPGAEIYSAAKDRDQASLVYAHVYHFMLGQNERLARLSGCEPMKSTKTITQEASGSFYRAVASDDAGAHGYNSHAVIIDELHAMRGKRGFIDALTTSLGKRPQPMLVQITTADFAGESYCNEQLEYARRVRDGLIDDPTFLPVIYEASKDDDWRDHDVWKRVNPNLGVSISEEYFASQCKRALEQPVYENTFKRLHLNIQTEQAERIIPMHSWEDCVGDLRFDVPEEREEILRSLRGRRCFAGLDLASRDDLTAFVLFFPDSKMVLPFFWCPRANAQARERRHRVPYLTWEKQGLIDLTPGNVIDFQRIRATINEACERYDVVDIGYDPAQCEQLAQQLGTDGRTMVRFPQTFVVMTEPVKTLVDNLIVGGELRHGDHRVLSWNAANASAERKDELVRFSKKKSAEKIDGVVALAMAVGRWLAAGSRRRIRPSVFALD